MKKRLHWSPEEIERYRQWKLKNLVEYVYFKSPFYRQFYDEHGVHPDMIKGESDLSLLPLLEKRHLRETDPLEFVTIKSEEAANTNWMIEVTTGTTGTPLHIYRTWRDLSHIKAKIIRAFEQTGLRLYHRQVVLKSSAESLTGKYWFEKFGILRKYWLGVTDAPEHNLKRLQEIQPQHLHGYPSGLLSIAELLRERSQTFHIPIICTGAEMLDTTVRNEIKEVFESEVFDLYGTREVGNIAWECTAHEGMHLNDDAIIVELLDENDAEVAIGEEGEVVVTYLDGIEFPLIRYRLGDRAVRMDEECSCGVQFSRLKVLSGRNSARIRLPSGELISGLIFQELRLIPWVSAYRIIQEDTESIKLQIVSKRKFEPAEFDDLVGRTSELVRGELEVQPEVLDKFEYDHTGKMQAVICLLPEQKDSNIMESD